MGGHVAGAFGRQAYRAPRPTPMPWAPPPTSTGHGIEFLARAKRFRHEVMLGDAEALVDAHRLRDLVVAARVKQKTTLERRRHDRWVIKEWPRQVSKIGRLNFIADTDHGAGIRLLDTRLCGSWHQAADWQFEEPSVTIGVVVLRADAVTAKLQLLPLTAIGIHALGRFFSRSFNNSEEALVDALVVLQKQTWVYLNQPSGTEFSIAAGDGSWHGHKIVIQNEQGQLKPLLRVQTYYCQE